VFLKILLILSLAAAQAPAAVPTPESHFGHRMGEDRKLLDWEKVVSWFQALEKSSDRIRVRILGQSAAGRPFLAATISSAANLRQLERYRDIQKRLADPRGTPEAEAARLFVEGKSVVLITCSVHSTEVASTLTAVELAWRLLTEDRPKFRAILENTIFLLVPSLNPDGVDIVTQWYRKTLGTPYEATSPPELYHKYVGHDNNRDWYIFSQPETRLTITQLHNAWHPQIVYDVHQQGPFASRMFVPPWMDPVDPNVDPLIAQQCNMIGAGMAADLTAAGKTGVAMNAIYDFWTPARHYQAYHGGMRILSESASARLASPITVRPEQINETAPGYLPRQRSWNYLEPWTGGEWRLRDIIDYQLIAMESVLYQAAIRREDLLRNFYRIGQRTVARTSPYAFVVPSPQADPGSSRKLLETLAFGLVEIERAEDRFQAGGSQFGAGSYVIRMQQPYGSFAKTLLERQQYPDLRLYPGGPPKRPYDVTAHTLPLLMGVEVATIATPFEAKARKADRFEFAYRGERAEGVLPASDIDSWKQVNRVWAQGGSLWRDPAGGDFHLRRSSSTLVESRRPRIGLYRSHMPSMDEGWTRWLLEQFGFAYQSVRNDQVQAGRLGERFDVLLFPDQPASAIAAGYREGSMPPEFTGGLGEKGAASLKEFAAAGGTLVFLNHSTEYAVDHLGVKLDNAVKGVSNRDFYSPGSLLNVTLQPGHPLTRGLPTQIAIWSEGSPAWKTGDEVRSLATYPASGILASGWLLGEKYLAGNSALAEATAGKGRIILFGMRPQYRGQSYQAFKMLFNALSP